MTFLIFIVVSSVIMVIFFIITRFDVDKEISVSFWEAMRFSKYLVPRTISLKGHKEIRTGFAYSNGGGWYPPNYVCVYLTSNSIILKPTFLYRRLGCYEIPYSDVNIVGERRLFLIKCYIFKLELPGGADVSFLIRKKSFLNAKNSFNKNSSSD
ncbi:MAG: hypothetical protein COB58_09895 [Thalassobium sp.]|nr:MAG: hypothetical protein COB43_11795 [Oceanospirillales bacterium]PHQ85068.1 MAG: hypothetical protein COB58_09895 [Thalassobium sp.]